MCTTCIVFEQRCLNLDLDSHRVYVSLLASLKAGRLLGVRPLASSGAVRGRHPTPSFRHKNVLNPTRTQTFSTLVLSTEKTSGEI